jgi:hypothetical protein
MNPNIYKKYNVDVPETFKRIDNFIGDNTTDLMENQLFLNESNVKIIKILISDLTALEGLNPKELKHREELIFRLISMLNLYYLSKADEIDVMETFFLVPEKSL